VLGKSCEEFLFRHVGRLAARGGKQCADNLLRGKRIANEVRFILRAFDGANSFIVIDLVSAPKRTSRVSGPHRVFSPN
jgi:hypothetical protein